ncbi:hypothetical protein RB195_010244 [Necator americanus]|uniref:Uncharacterized protein n=1 Tax=Necator americanus TaxID=51031 RepID=A0ABR1CX34_NECAM
MARVRLSVSENVSLRVRRRKGDVYGVIDRVEATFCDCKAYQLLPPTKTIGFLHSYPNSGLSRPFWRVSILDLLFSYLYLTVLSVSTCELERTSKDYRDDDDDVAAIVRSHESQGEPTA